MPAYYIAPLFFWQILLLGGLCGALGAFNMAWGLMGMALLLFALGWPPVLCKKPVCGFSWLRLLALWGVWALFAANLAGIFGQLVQGNEDRQPLPAWLQAGGSIRVEGKVAEVRGLSGKRLRIVLENVHPAGAQNGKTKEQVEEGIPKIAWTWENPLFRPLQGQQLSLTSRLYPVLVSYNPGLLNAGEYYSRQGIFHTAQSVGAKGQVNVQGEAGLSASLREKARLVLEKALFDSEQIFPKEEREATGRENLAEPEEKAAEKDGQNLPIMAQSRAILLALLFGDKFWVEDATIALFTKAGLVHSLALSGQHLALAGLLAVLCIFAAGSVYPRLFLHVPRKTLIVLATMPFAALYLWMGDAPLSLIRASIMVCCAAVFWVSRQKNTLLDALFLCAALFLLAWPQGIMDMAVQLSFLSVLGIALVAPLLDRVSHTHLPVPQVLKAAPLLPIIWYCIKIAGKAIVLGAITSLAVTAATLPVLVQTFGVFSVCIFLNILWLPILGIWVLPLAALGLCVGLVFGGTAVAVLAPYILAMAATPVEIALNILEALNQADALVMLQALKPIPVVIFGYAAAFVALTGLAGKGEKAWVQRLCVAALILLPFGALVRESDALLAHREARVVLTLLDVGQGQAILLEYPGGRALIDAGGVLSPRFDTGRDIVAHVLTRNAAPRLNLAAVSHPHTDHARGMLAILENFSVGVLMESYISRQVKEVFPHETVREKRAIPLHLLVAGDIVELSPGLHLQVLSPQAASPYGSIMDTNDMSLVLRLTYMGKGLALLCGDALAHSIKHIVSKAAPGSLQADALILPHHGSNTSLVYTFYTQVQPKLALVSCGRINRYGFPGQAVLNALQEQDVPVLGTHEYGAVRLTWHHGILQEVETFATHAVQALNIQYTPMGIMP